MELDISGKKDQKHYNRRDQEAKKTEFWEDLNAMIRGRMESNNKNNHGI